MITYYSNMSPGKRRQAFAGRPEEEPLFANTESLFDIAGMERLASEGFDTPRGYRSLEFRVGIEIEFQIGEPEHFRKTVTDNTTLTELDRRRWASKVLNQDTLGKMDQDNIDMLEQFRVYSRGFLDQLVPQDAQEHKKKEEWLDQIDDFTVRDITNFLIYEQFSRPRLDSPVLGSDCTLAELDNFTEENRWIEWRFGNGTLQSGYYDNPGVSEIRLCPCSPQEALRRKAIVLSRMAEIGTELGVLVATGADYEHINVSAYNSQDPKSPSIFGNATPSLQDAIDTASSVMAAYCDGIGLDPEIVKYSNKHFSEQRKFGFGVGPTRKNLRILDGRLELRAGFSSTAQGIASLLAGTIYGLRSGKDAVSEQGYENAQIVDIFRVLRSDKFVKEDDLYIQRLFENVHKDEYGRFSVSQKFMRLNGISTEKALFSDGTPIGMSVELVASAVMLNESGTPYVTAAALQEVRHVTPNGKMGRYGSLNLNTLEDDIAKLNDRLATIRLAPSVAVVGKVEYRGSPKDRIFDRLRSSGLVSLALGSSVEVFVANIDKATEYFEARAGDQELI